MAINSSGAVSFGDINVELGLSRTAQISLGGAGPRTLAGVPSGAIRTAADFYGKSNTGTVYLENVSLNAVSQAYNDTPTSSLAGVRMLDSGVFQGIINDDNTSGWYTLFNWRTGGSTAPWSFRATQTFASGGTGGTSTADGDFTTGWVAASTLPQWTVSTNTNQFQRFGSVTRIFTLELALTSDTSNVLASASISIQSSSQTNEGEIP